MLKLGYKKNPDVITIGEINSNLIISDNLDLNLYNDITSIQNWVLFEAELNKDVLYIRERLRENLNNIGWSGCSNTDKDIIIKYYLKETIKTEQQSDTEKVMFLISKGYTLQQAQGILIKAYADFHILEIDACYQRANCSKLFTIIGKYLTVADASDLIKITHMLFDLYKTQAIRGTTYGTAGEGILDFIESTPGTSYEFTGLEQQGYILNTGTYISFINELLDVLKFGNY